MVLLDGAVADLAVHCSTQAQALAVEGLDMLDGMLNGVLPKKMLDMREMPWLGYPLGSLVFPLVEKRQRTKQCNGAAKTLFFEHKVNPAAC